MFRAFYFSSTVFLLIVGALCFCSKSVCDDHLVQTVALSLLIFQFFGYLYLQKSREPKLFAYLLKPTNIILFSLIVVNLQVPFDIYIGNGSLSTYIERIIYEGAVGKTFILGILALSAFMLGNSYKFRIPTKNLDKQIKRFKIKGKFFWLFFLVVSFLMFIKNIDIIAFFTGLNYSGSGASDREADASAIWENLLDVFATIIICQVTLKELTNQKSSSRDLSVIAYLRKYPILFLIIEFLYILLRLVSGDRGPVIYTVLMFLYSYLIISKKQIKAKILIPLAIIGVFSLNLINTIRSFSPGTPYDERFVRALSEMFESNNNFSIPTVSPATLELAKSSFCNYIAIDDIDKNYTNYKYGFYNFCELAQSVPTSQRVIKSLFGIDIYRECTSEYVTISYFGSEYPLGLGTSAVTDFYLDFGVIGVVLGLFLIGLIFKRLDAMLLYSSNLSFISMLFFIKFTSMAVYIPRASLSFVCTRFLYICILYFIVSISIAFFYCFVKTKKNENLHLR